LGKSITRAALIKSSRIHNCSYRDWDQRTPSAECALQRSLGRYGNLAKKAQQIFAAHQVNLADTLPRASSNKIGANFNFASCDFGPIAPLAVARFENGTDRFPKHWVPAAITRPQGV
jgi:hypothetical protein